MLGDDSTKKHESFFFESQTNFIQLEKENESTYKASSAGGGSFSYQKTSSLRCLTNRAKEWATPLAARLMALNSTSLKYIYTIKEWYFLGTC